MKKKLIRAEEKALIEVRQMMRDAMGFAGINQAELSRRLGVTQGRISQILHKDPNPTIGTIAKVLFACGCRMQIKLPRRS